MKYAFSFFLLLLCGESWAQLTCNNCTFTSGGATVTGNPTSLAVILASPGTFTGDIDLTGPCNFIISGTGDYHLSGRIRGNFPLTYNAPNAGSEGHSAGITLEGANANTYTGQTTITGGYVICNKPNGVAAIPALPQPGTTIKISATSAGVSAHLWCQKDNQLGTGAIIDFSDAQTYSYSHLNGTTQTVAGLQSNNGRAVVENNWDNIFLPVGLTAAQLSTSPATLNIAAGSTTYTFGGGAYIRKGSGSSPFLTVNVTSGTQAIRDHNGNISNVSLIAQAGGTWELNAGAGQAFRIDMGVRLAGPGTFVKTGSGEIRAYNFRPAGAVQVMEGTLILWGISRLGDDQPYTGTLSIAAGAILDYNSSEIVDFRGDITGAGLLRRTGGGKALISGNKKTFTGNVLVSETTFFGGNGDISNASFNVSAGGKLGGGEGQNDVGGKLTVGDLTFESRISRLVVTALSATDNTPSLVEVKAAGTNNAGSVTLREGSFTIDVVDSNVVNGYLLKCSNGLSSSLPVPVLGINNTGKGVAFGWDNTGLYITILERGLVCDNCTFTSGEVTVTGTPASLAVILASPGTFTGDIDLTGPCSFTISGTGDYHLSGQIRGNFPLTYNAPNVGTEGHDAGFTLDGGTANTYTGLTNLTGGYLICNKNDGVASVPGDIKVSATSFGRKAQLWCRTNNQLGNGATVLDFSDAQGYSYIHLNGTTQTIAGLRANNGIAVVQSNESGYFPAGMTAAQLSGNSATLNIAAASNNTCIFGGGAYIRKGSGNSSSLTVNVTSGTQVIRDPGNNTLNNVSLIAQSGGTWELNASAGKTFSIQDNARFTGAGTFVKTGAGEIQVNGFRPVGAVQVMEGTLTLWGSSKLGDAQPYTETLSIAAGGTLDHGNYETTDFRGDITGTGLLRRTGSGNTLFSGNKKTFTGNVLVAGSSFFGGYGDISNASFNVTASGRVGGGEGQNNVGGNLTVGDLTFESKDSRLVVTALSATNHTPSLVEVKAKGTDDVGSVTLRGGNFTVDVVDNTVVNGYILKCSNGLSSNLPVPIVGTNSPGKALSFSWDNTGLYMTVIERGLVCDNCTFTSGGATVRGTPTSPAVILSSPGSFTSNIDLTGPCNFIISGTGDYHLSGQISGNFPLTYNAPNAGSEGHGAGFTLDGGGTANTYTGLTTLATGYIICYKDDGVAAVPGDIKVSASSGIKPQLWCRTNNQLGNGSTVIDFNDAQTYSYIHLNGTTQTIAGLRANKNTGVVQNSESGYFPAGMTAAQVSTNSGTLNIAAASNNSCIFEGGYIRKGSGNFPALTVNITSGTQVIRSPNGYINNVSFIVQSGGTLEFNAGVGQTFWTSGDAKFTGTGTFLKTGAGEIRVSNFRPSGDVQVREGTLSLEGSSKLGDTQPYTGTTLIAAGATLEKNNNEIIDFRGDITGAGLLRCTGDGKTILSGNKKTFTGNLLATGNALLGGYADCSNASFHVAGSGRVGGGEGQDDVGGTLTVGDLTFESKDSRLVVTSLSAADNTPSLVEVRAKGTNDAGRVTLLDGNFTVEIVANSLVSGYVLKCSNGLSSNLPLPIVGANSVGKWIVFNWDNTGLYMTVIEQGLMCDNCSFTGPGNTTVRGTPTRLAVILSSPGAGPFTGDIDLTGPCNFIISGTGDYHLSGQIRGNFPLTYNAPNAGARGHDAGITLDGGGIANTYTGLTTIAGGYIICNKDDGVAAVPGDIKVLATSSAIRSNLWCRTNNQLGNGATVLDFRDAQNYSYIHLNGTTQTIAGLRVNNDRAVVQNYENGYFPAGMTAAQLSTNGATLNIVAGSNTYTYEGGGNIRGGAQALTVNLVSGTLIIRYPNTNIHDMTLTSAKDATLEFYSDASTRYNETFAWSDGYSLFGYNVSFRGEGLIKATGPGVTAIDSPFLKSGGKLWIPSGRIQNDGGWHSSNNFYSTGTETNLATLQLGTPDIKIRRDGTVVRTAAGNPAPTFSIGGCNTFFDGLTGIGAVISDFGQRWGGYAWFVLGTNNSQGNPVFDGVIDDNLENGIVRGGSFACGGITLRKMGTGTQVLRGDNRYTGITQVTLGTLKLQGNGQLGDSQRASGDYRATIEIFNTAGIPAIFEHNGDKTQIFTGNIISRESGTTWATFLQSGTGKSIINGSKDFAGNVSSTGGFLGGTGDLSKANAVTVGGTGGIGGGNAEMGGGATFTVSNLTFAADASRLVVTSRPDNTPSVVDVRVTTTTTTPGTVSVTGSKFTVDVLGGPALVDGYIMYCTNGVTDSLPLPAVGVNNTGKSVCFKWDATGLYMYIVPLIFDQPDDITVYCGQYQPEIKFTTKGIGETAPSGYQWKQKGTYDGEVGLADYTTDWTRMSIPPFTAVVTSSLRKRTIEVTAVTLPKGCTTSKTFTYTVLPTGLTCDNCSFTRPDNTFVTGTIEDPAVILSSPGTFTGNITLKGPCNFIIAGPGDYHLSGIISGTGPLTYNAPAAGQEGHSAGITLDGGATANTYTGLTTLASGYIICNKNDGVAAVPGDIKLSATTTAAKSHLWCRTNNQLGSGTTVIDFSDAQSYSYIHLNGTTQTIAGLKANNGIAVVQSNENGYFPAGMTDDQLSSSSAVLNIAAAANNTCTFGGGAYIRKGSGKSLSLTVNVTGGTQIIQDPNGNINNVTFITSVNTQGEPATLEFKSSDGNTHTIGSDVTFGGAGILKKTGTALITTNTSNIFKTGGKIWVTEGMFRNENYGNKYANGDSTQIDRATLQVEANAAFDIWANASIFDGLTGGGTIQNNWGPTPEVNVPPGGGYCWLTLGQNNSQGNPSPFFDGIIKDNPGNGPVSTNGLGAGGIALKKVGTGTQVLKGGNLYTGRTRVSSGTLKLEGNGVLGATTTGGSYGGILEISNASDELTRAVFEYKGDKTQVITGNITTTGTGIVLGTYLQSGAGKTIIEGVKSFAGNVTITGGFLGGSGDLSKAGNVTVGANGSIGGGYGVGGNGGNLTVAGLNFAEATSKLVVTPVSSTDGTPGLLDVKISKTTDQGPVSAAKGFTVEVNGTTIVSGYVLKCTNGVSDKLSLPTVVNNSGKALCFKWDATGLWMQTSLGNITLASSSVCPKGLNPGNLAITITATYTDSRDYPSQGATVDFSLSEASVKSSGNLLPARGLNNLTMTTTFDGVNQTAADKPYTITYNDHQNCLVTLAATINPQPVLSINSGGNPACKGIPIVLQATGTGTLTIFSVNTNMATVANNTPSTGLATATTLAVGDINFGVTDINGCKSEYLSVSVKALPAITLANSTICGATSISLTADHDPATASAWSIELAVPDASIEDKNPLDREANLVVNILTEQKSITVQYTDRLGCRGTTTLTVKPNPIITVNTIDASKLCSGLIYTDALVYGEGTWAVYKTGTAERGLSTVVATPGHVNIQAPNVTVKTIEDIVFTSPVTSCKNKLTITIYPKPVMNLIPNLTTCGNMLVPDYTPASPAGVPEEAKVTHYKWKAEAVNPTNVGLPNYTADWSKTAISQFTAVNPTSVLKREVTVYAYNATSGCQAEPQVYTITINPGLAATYTAASPICNGTETDVVLRSSLSPVTYTWTVNNNSVRAQSQTTASNTSFIRQTLTNSGSSPETVTYQVTGTSGICSGTVSIPIQVSNRAPVTPTVTGGGHHCVISENGTYQTNLIPSVPGTNNVEWTYTSYYGNDQVAASLTGNTQKAERGTLTAVNDNLVLSNTSSASVYYVFRPYSAGCFGTPSDPIGVRLYAAPAITAIPAQEVCSSSEAYPTAINIALSSSTPDVVYTWTVDRINGHDVTGYSELSDEGARVPTQNPAQARSGLISDALSLPANADTQTIDYRITPWHFGCPGQAVVGRVKVNPLPVITAPADREHCLGDAAIRVAAEPLKGTAMSFTWTGGVKAGLADQTVYGPGLPAYRVASTTTSVAVKVTILGKNDKGCKASTSFHIAVNPKPSITLGNPQTLCAGPTIETAAQTNIKVSSPIAGTKYKWTASFVDFRSDGKSEVKVVNANNELLALPVRESPREEGNFIRKITAAADSYAQVTFRLTPFLGNCAGEGKDTDVIVKGVNLLTGLANNSPDVCSGGTTSIKIGKEGDGNTYSWERINNSNNILAPAAPTSSSRYTTISDVLTLSSNKRDSIIYRITPGRRFTTGDGNEYYCSGKSASATVFVNPIPVLSLSPTTASICSGESTAITCSVNLEQPESNEVYYSWEVTPNGVGARSSSGFQKGIPQQVLTNDNASESSVTYTITPQYQHGAAGGTCKGQPVTSTYRVGSRARASINDIPAAVCLGDKVTLKTDSKGANFQWLKNGKTIPGATGDSYVVPTDSVSVSSYAVAITAGCGSSTSEARKVKVSADAYFTGGSAATDKAAAAMGEAVKFSYTGPKADYLWNFNDHTPMPNTESVAHSYTKPGTYYPTLKVTKPGQAACTKTFSFSLEIRSVNPTISVGYGVFPIPARDKLTISSNEEEDLQNIALSDMSGKVVLNEAVKGHNVTLSVAHIAQGIYLLTITNSKSEVKRLEIAKE